MNGDLKFFIIPSPLSFFVKNFSHFSEYHHDSWILKNLNVVFDYYVFLLSFNLEVSLFPPLLFFFMYLFISNLVRRSPPYLFFNVFTVM